jgi:hypothetical protein
LSTSTGADEVDNPSTSERTGRATERTPDG